MKLQILFIPLLALISLSKSELTRVHLGTESDCKTSCLEEYGKDQENNGACARGCRFSAIQQLVQNGNTENKTEECDESCNEAYSKNEPLIKACGYGCRKQRVLNPMESLLETQPDFTQQLTPAGFFDSVQSFFNDFSSAVSQQQGQDGAHPISIVRVWSGPVQEIAPNGQLSVKLFGNHDPFNDEEFFPFPPAIMAPRNEMQPVPIAFRQMNPAKKCLGPTYDSLLGPQCRAYIPMFQFNQETRQCEKFIFGGCPDVDNMFSTEQDCLSTCHDFMRPAEPKTFYRRLSDRLHGRGFERSLMLFCLGGLALCALLGAMSSMCLYMVRRNRQHINQYGRTYIAAAGDHTTSGNDKIFLVAPQMGMETKPKALPPTYSDVLLASQNDQNEEKQAAGENN